MRTSGKLQWGFSYLVGVDGDGQKGGGRECFFLWYQEWYIVVGETWPCDGNVQWNHFGRIHSDRQCSLGTFTLVKTDSFVDRPALILWVTSHVPWSLTLISWLGCLLQRATTMTLSDSSRSACISNGPLVSSYLSLCVRGEFLDGFSLSSCVSTDSLGGSLSLLVCQH